MNRRTKAICTIGPASFAPEVLEKLVAGGMDVARFNFSHNQDNFKEVRDLIKGFAQKYNRDVEIMMDLQGPRVRIGELPEEGVELKEGEKVMFSTSSNDNGAIHINDKYLHETIQTNQPIFLANGDMELLVEKVEGSTIYTRVIRGGILHSHKGVNVPETNVKNPSMTDKDRSDLQFGLEAGADIVALSFVKNAQDARELKELVKNTSVKTCAKIEIKTGLRNIDEIIPETDMIMVARGDLGIELPLEEIPIAQKMLIRRCKEFRKPVIVATQMLMSMVGSYRPTRAEVTDVANAVLDGAQYCMLSDETAFGKYPVEALTYLVKIITKAEEYTTIAL